MNKRVLVTLILLLVTLAVIFFKEIAQAIIIVAYTVAGLLALIFGLLAGLTVWYVVERIRLLRARRIEAEKRAHVLTVTAGNQVFIRDTDLKATWRAMHLEARTYINHQDYEPSDQEMHRWQWFNAPKRLPGKIVEFLPAHAPVDVLAALDNAQCALIVGQRDSGKTTLLQHVIQRRLGKSRVLVLDPHSHPTRWPQGCLVIGTERDFVKIETALKGLLVLMNKRYRDIGKGLIPEGEHEPVTVIIDEWRAIVFQLGKPAADIIKTLLAESRKTNIDVFVGTHSERVKPLGIEGEGDLKEGFVVVRLSINKQTQERKATIDFGEGELPARLPGPFTGPAPDHLQLQDPNDLIPLEPEPNEEERKILEMHRAGESLRSISKAVYNGKVGQFYNQKIQAVLEKYGEK